jgi:hypothetical protein
MLSHIYEIVGPRFVAIARCQSIHLDFGNPPPQNKLKHYVGTQRANSLSAQKTLCVANWQVECRQLAEVSGSTAHSRE